MAQHLGRRIFVVLLFLGAAVAFVVLRPAPVGASVAAEVRAPLSQAGATRKRARTGKRKRRR